MITEDAPMMRAGRGIAWGAAAAGSLLTVAGLAGADEMLAQTARIGDGAEQALGSAVTLLDFATGKEITKFLLGTVLVLAGLALNIVRRRGLWTGALLYVGAVQLLSTAIADFAKPPFGRMRPFQAFADQGGDRWFMGPDFGSFPSGHAAFYLGLCLPLALLFPRWAAPLLAVPLLVGAERVLSHDHYLSDVGASFLLAASLAGIFWKLMRPDLSTGSSQPKGE